MFKYYRIKLTVTDNYAVKYVIIMEVLLLNQFLDHRHHHKLETDYQTPRFQQFQFLNRLKAEDVRQFPLWHYPFLSAKVRDR